LTRAERFSDVIKEEPLIVLFQGRAFDDCLVTESIFKLLQIFGSLIQRNLIALELSDRMPVLVTMLNQVNLVKYRDAPFKSNGGPKKLYLKYPDQY